ncbi:MAG: peptide chain release factor 3 [Proteobacteria bacterium]|nr:peptide chain release factor 3 [Pseudomonadota bacterium]
MKWPSELETNLDEISHRRTFAIISHPDAGKTTITEKLLLYAGALHIAGAVKARKASRHAVSDWMAMEREKGISITTSVLQFESDGKRINLLDTPGHADFSEDTYRTLAAVDSALMLMDNAKGVEPRTRKLFEVCRLRRLPVMTFINKMARPGLEPLELLDQVAETLDIRTVALNWPIGMGQDFAGIYDRMTHEVVLYDRVVGGTEIVPELVTTIDDPRVTERIGDRAFEALVEEIDLLEGAGEPWDQDAYLKGDLTPFFFGSAMTNFAVKPVLAAINSIAPSPRRRQTTTGWRQPTEPGFSGFIFKIQANMNPRHRDRIAFMRVVSGAFTRGMRVRCERSGKDIRLAKPHTFLAADRAIVDSAVPGDIVGLYDSGEFRIGDTLYDGEALAFKGIPRFAPEHFARLRLKDPERRKQLQQGLKQLSLEGSIQLFVREDLGPADPYLGAVGMLQFEVLKDRLLHEYRTQVQLEPAPFTVARWVSGEPTGLAWLKERSDYQLVTDRDGRFVVLARTPWSLTYALSEAPGLELLDVSPV